MAGNNNWSHIVTNGLQLPLQLREFNEKPLSQHDTAHDVRHGSDSFLGCKKSCCRVTTTGNCSFEAVNFLKGQPF